MFAKIDTESDIRFCVKLAEEIWKDHYTPVIGSDQVNYMLEKFQSTKAVNKQIEEGFHYYLIDSSKGYFSYIHKADCLFISKLYVHKNFRGQGLGKKAIDFISSKAIDKKILRLTVNRNNFSAVEFYKRQRFKIAEEADFDIGNSFFMNDYVMEKNLS